MSNPRNRVWLAVLYNRPEKEILTTKFIVGTHAKAKRQAISFADEQNYVLLTVMEVTHPAMEPLLEIMLRLFDRWRRIPR